jgi:PTS system galactitol-specific IIA component
MILDDMQTSKKQCVFKDLLVIPLTAPSSQDAMAVLADTLYQEGHVTSEYKAAVIKRERIFPTGIPTATPAAIPHTDAEFCKHVAMAVGVAVRPISFGVMGGEQGETIPLRLIFMLSLPEPKTQVAMIQKMVQMLRDNEMMSRMVGSELPEIKKLLISYFENGSC